MGSKTISLNNGQDTFSRVCLTNSLVPTGQRAEDYEMTCGYAILYYPTYGSVSDVGDETGDGWEHKVSNGTLMGIKPIPSKSPTCTTQNALRILQNISRPMIHEVKRP